MYKQFAITVAVSTVLSAFVALSLTPALCALMLKPKDKTNGQALPGASLAASTGFSNA
jgi:HAE1 family hydrophobic/amphiphilic exporter-1